MDSVNVQEYTSGNYNRVNVLWFKYFYLGHDYLLESPLKNSFNKERILNINLNIHKEYNPVMYELLSVYEKNNDNLSNLTKQQLKKWNLMLDEYGIEAVWENYKDVDDGFKYLKKILTNGKDDKDISKVKKKNDKIDKKKKKKNTKNNKKRKDRPSPSESATTFKVGTKKKGNDGNMWIIVENKNGVRRWSKIK